MSDPSGKSDPGRWFDAVFYRARNPDVVWAGLDPYAHYRRYGEPEGRAPSPWFDPHWYRRTYAVPADMSPLTHFLTHRATGRFLPCAALYPISLSLPEGGDPFDRYLAAHLQPERELLPDLAPLAASGLIQADYHAINGTDIFMAELDPPLHYARFGWQHGLRPNTAFDPHWYSITAVNPLMHYITEGEAAGRRPVLWFDPQWYRRTYAIPDGQLALAHYLANRIEGTVSPNPYFDAAWYAARHALAIPAGIDPFSHFLTAGAVTDIDPSPHFNAGLWRHRHMAPSGSPYHHLLTPAERNPLLNFLQREVAPHEPGCGTPRDDP